MEIDRTGRGTRRLLAVAAVFAVAVSAVSCKKKEVPIAPQLKMHVEQVTVVVPPGKRLDVTLAATEFDRDELLKETGSICEDCGIMLAYGVSEPRTFSTSKLQFDADLIWLDQLFVAGTNTGLRGRSSMNVSSPANVTSVLLVSPGRAGALGIVPGTAIEIRRQ